MTAAATSDHARLETQLRSHFDGVTTLNGNACDFMVRCPAHADGRPSLHITWDRKTRRTLMKCFAGCTNAAIAKALKLPDEHRLYALFDERGARPARRAQRARIRLVDAAPAGQSPIRLSGKNLKAVYNYHDEQGQWLYSVERYEQGGSKTFRPWVPTDDDKGVRSLKGVRLVLYRLHRLKDLPAVFLVEGEKCADALSALGLPATTSQGGAERWRPDYAQQLATQGVQTVIILADNDAGGRKYADAAARDCLAAGLSVRRLDLPDLEPKEDVADWLDAGGTPDALVALANDAPAYEPKPAGATDERASSEAADLLERYVYSIGTKRFIDVETLEQFDKEQFDAAHAVSFNLRDKTPPASIVFLNDPQGRKVSAPTYRPGAPRFITEAGLPTINFYRESDVVAVGGDVTPWLEHARYLLPDKRVRRVVLDWMAYLLQHPDRKMNWAVFLGGTQGTGKDALFEPLRLALGDHNTAVISPDDLTNGWTDWLKDSKLVMVQEFAAFEKKALMNRLKSLITAPPTKLRINSKNVPQYYIPNLASFVFFSNFRDALVLEQDDRRFFVYWSPAEPREPAYYHRLYDWMRANAAAVFHWLLQRDVSTFDAVGHAPMTADKAEVIRESQSALEHFLREQWDAGAKPMHRDLVVINRLLAELPEHVGRVSWKAVATVLRRLGAQELTKQLRLDDGSRPRVWALRRAELYQQMSEKDLSKTYAQQGLSRHLATAGQGSRT